MMRTVARWAVALASLAVLISAAVGAVALHDRSVADKADSKHAQLHRAGQRLRDITTLLQGSALPPADRNTCVRFAQIDEERYGRRYPPIGSADWNYVMSVCAGDNE
jgi:hypothetical protein